MARMRIEEAFGQTNTIAGLGRTRLQGRPKVEWASTVAAGAYSLIRLPKLITAEA